MTEPTPHEARFSNIIIPWRGHKLYPSEEDLLDAEGNMDKLVQLINEIEEGVNHAFTNPNTSNRSGFFSKRKLDQISGSDTKKEPAEKLLNVLFGNETEFEIQKKRSENESSSSKFQALFSKRESLKDHMMPGMMLLFT